MVTHKRKKVTKYRGSNTHGGGHGKKRRGAGSRGGRGFAGSGKRSGHKKNLFVNKLGRKGFTSRNFEVQKGVNLGFFTAEKINQLLSEGKVQKEGEFYLVDLEKLGFNKLLGTGSTELKLKITAPYCSAKAAEKLEAAGSKLVSGDKKSEAAKK